MQRLEQAEALKAEGNVLYQAGNYQEVCFDFFCLVSTYYAMWLISNDVQLFYQY